MSTGLVRFFHISRWTAAMFVLPALAADCARISEALQFRDRAAEWYVRGELPKAIEDLRISTRICPADGNLAFMLGNALYRAGELRKASVAYGSAVESLPRHFEARMSLGFTEFELGAAEKALEQWQAAAGLNGASAFARAALACALFKLGRMEEAAGEYDAATFLDARYAEIDSLTVDIRWKPAVFAALRGTQAWLEQNRTNGN